MTCSPPGARAALVALLGDVNIDQTLTVPAIPSPGGDVVASSQRTQIGGSATNTAIALRRTGLRARLIARVGADPYADAARAALLAEGVDVGHLCIDPVEPTATNMVLVTPDGERTMYAYRGANAALAPEHLRSDALDGVGALHLSGYALLAAPQRDAALRAVADARRRGIPVTLDVPVAAAERAAADTLGLLPDLAVMMVGESEARAHRVPDDGRGGPGPGRPHARTDRGQVRRPGLGAGHGRPPRPGARPAGRRRRHHRRR